MALEGDDLTADVSPEAGGDPGGPPGGDPGGGDQGAPPPPGGGPILAALARRGMQPPVSAPGAGNMASGLMLLKNAVSMIHDALPSLEAGSAPHKDAIKALTSLSRHLPQGAPSAGLQQTQLGDMLRNTVRNALLQRIMQQKGQGQGQGQQGQGQGPQGPDQSPPGMPTQPVPSMPLPGA